MSVKSVHSNFQFLPASFLLILTHFLYRSNALPGIVPSKHLVRMIKKTISYELIQNSLLNFRIFYMMHLPFLYTIRNRQPPQLAPRRFRKCPQLTDQQIHQILAVHGISTLTHITDTQSHTKSITASCVSHSHKRHLLPRLIPRFSNSPHGSRNKPADVRIPDKLPVLSRLLRYDRSCGIPIPSLRSS